MLVCVATLMGDYLEVDLIYRSWVVTIQEFDDQVDLIMIDMVKFNARLGME